MLPQAIETMEAWGFRYVTQLIWVKTTKAGAPAMGLGYVARNAHELLLLGKRGKVKYGPGRKRLLSVFHARRGRHSVKPPNQYEVLEKLVPEGERCELFARERRPGWHGWGDELEEAGHA